MVGTTHRMEAATHTVLHQQYVLLVCATTLHLANQVQGYNSYQPPRPDSANRYRGSPAPQYNNQVSQYRENDYYGEQRGSEHHHHSEKGGFAPVVYGDDRPSSRGSRDAGSERGFGDEKKPKYGKKDIGAMVAGAAVGGEYRQYQAISKANADRNR